MNPALIYPFIICSRRASGGGRRHERATGDYLSPPLGGLAGAVAVFAGLTLIDKLGAGTVNGLTITANIVTSIAIDHFGLLNAPVHEASHLRLVGGALMVGGIVLISRF